MSRYSKSRTIILEENINIRNRIKSLFFQDKKYDVVLVIASFSSIEIIIENYKPDIIILNSNTATYDIDLIKKELMIKYPNIIIDSLYRVLEEKYCRTITDFSDFYKTIIDEQIILDNKNTYKMKDIVKLNGKTKKEIIRQRYIVRITDLLLLIGVPSKLLGYRFIRYAILLSIEKPKLLIAVTKGLYPEIAKKYHTTPTAVERSIRHAIEMAWAKGRIHKINELYNIDIFDEFIRPTNGELISTIADKVRLDISYTL